MCMLSGQKDREKKDWQTAEINQDLKMLHVTRLPLRPLCLLLILLLWLSIEQTLQLRCFQKVEDPVTVEVFSWPVDPKSTHPCVPA